MDDETEVKIIRLIVRLSLFSLLCFFLWSFFIKKAVQPKPLQLEQNPKYIRESKSSSPQPQLESELVPNIPPQNKLPPLLKPESKLDNKKPKEEIKQIKQINSSSKPLIKKTNSPPIISSKPISSKRELPKDKNISTEQEQIPESVKIFQEQLRKKYKINALATNYAASLGLTQSQTRALLRQLVNLNQSNLCGAWKVKRHCPSDRSFEEIGYYAINAQLIPCMQKLKTKEQMLNKKYTSSEKMQFLLSCY